MIPKGFSHTHLSSWTPSFDPTPLLQRPFSWRIRGCGLVKADSRACGGKRSQSNLGDKHRSADFLMTNIGGIPFWRTSACRHVSSIHLFYLPTAIADDQTLVDAFEIQNTTTSEMPGHFEWWCVAGISAAISRQNLQWSGQASFIQLLECNSLHQQRSNKQHFTDSIQSCLSTFSFIQFSTTPTSTHPASPNAQN